MKISSVIKTTSATFLTACLLNMPVHAAPTKIPADAVEWHGHSYYVYPGRFATWEEAKRFCESLGGHLAIINDDSENKRVYEIMREFGHLEAYFGLSDTSGRWKWVDGTSLTYTNWGVGEPNNPMEHYGMYHRNLGAYKWNDGLFSGGVADGTFICEWESSKQSVASGQAVNRVTVEGTGANRDSAIRDAARNAVEQVVGVYIDSRSLTRNSKLALDEIYAKSQGYVKNVTVIDENYSDGNCNVTANIEVDNNPDSQLINQLSMIMMLNDPRISVIVLKENTSPTEHDNISETAMNERLIDLGFSHIVDANIVSNLQNAELLNNIYNGKSSLSGVGDSYGTDYLVLGKSNVDVIPASGANMGKADLSVKIIKFDTGDIIGTFTVEGQGAEKVASYAERRALKSASSEAAKKLEEKFKKLSAAPVQSMQITVTTSNYDNIEQLVKELKSLNGVQHVNIREYRNGRAVLEVESTQNPNSLLQILKTSTGLKFSVEEISAAGMKIIIS